MADGEAAPAVLPDQADEHVEPELEVELIPPAPPVLGPPPSSECGPILVDPVAQAEFERFGFAVISLFDDEVLGQLREAAAALGPAPDDPRVSMNLSFHSSDLAYKRAVNELARIAAPSISAGMHDQEVYLATFITKWPGTGGAFPPHQDPTLVDERRFAGITMWVPLHDVDQTNGMLHVLPGSHRFPTQMRTHEVFASMPFSGLSDVIVEELGYGVPMKAGEVLIFDNRAIHHSLPNRSDRPREIVAFALRPCAASCVLIERDQGDPEVCTVYEVADSFYVADHAAGESGPMRRAVGRVRQPAVQWTADQLRGMAAAVGGAPRRGEGPSSLSPELLDSMRARCSVCGTPENLTWPRRAMAGVGRVDDAFDGEPSGLVCPACSS